MSKVLKISVAVLLLTAPAWADWTEADGHGWTELGEPTDDVSLDLASVIAPEPVTLLVLGLGLIPTLLKRCKRTNPTCIHVPAAQSKPIRTLNSDKGENENV